MLLLSPIFNIKIDTQKFTNFDIFKMHNDMTADKIVSNEFKDI